MNHQLQTILDFVQQNENISAEEKDMLLNVVKKADRDLTISEFKLDFVSTSRFLGRLKLENNL